jgi:hypothetical protein
MKTRFHLLLLLVLSVISACTTTSSMFDASQTQRLEDKWGVKIVAARLSAADIMIDVRYQIVDPEKAKPLFARKIKPYAIIEKTGAKVGVPQASKVGSLRQRPETVEKDKIYFVFFSNPGRSLKSGDTISVVIGDFKVEHVKVM